MYDQILEKLGIKYEELNDVERETLNSWVQSIDSNQITIEKIREYIELMKAGVETQLIDEPEFNYIFIFKVPNRKQILLKARLRNYLLLEQFLLTPEKAKQNIERMLANIRK